MSQAEYAVYLADHTGSAYRKNITGAVIGLEATRIVNGIGSCALTLDPQALDASYYKRDARIIVERSLPGRLPALLFDTVYLLRRMTMSYNGITKTRSLHAYDLNHLLTRRIIAYYAGSSQAKKTSAIDDMIKAYVNEALGASATDAARRWNSYITIGANLTAAPSTTKAAAWRPLMQTIQELAQASTQAGTYLAFDLWAASETSWRFDTFTQQRGTDRRYGYAGQFVLSLQRGNFDNITLERNWADEITACYAGAQGVESERNVQSSIATTRAGASAFGRIEAFSDVRHLGQTETGAATDEAEARCREGRPKTTLHGDIIETDGAIYGVHYNWGDYVTANIDDEQFDCRLDVARCRLQRTQNGLEERFDMQATLEESDDL